MAFHLAYWSWAPDTSTPKSALAGATSFPELAPYTWWGWVGVEIFFVLSGFVIANSAANATPLAFLRGRFLRLFPAAAICASITLVTAFAVAWAPAVDLLKLYIKTLAFWPLGGWIDGVYWTLGIELAFYAIVLALLMVHRFSLLGPAMAVVGFGSTLAWACHFVLSGPIGAPSAFGIQGRYLELLLVHHGMYFASGVFLWLGLVRGWTPFRLLLTAATLVGGLLPILSEANGKVGATTLDGMQWVPLVLWSGSVAAIWASVRFDVLTVNWSPRVLNAIQVAGLSTYPLYLLHDLVGAAMLRGLVVVGLERYTALLLVMATMVGASTVLTVTAERRLRDLLRSLLSFHRAAVPVEGLHRQDRP